MTKSEEKAKEILYGMGCMFFLVFLFLCFIYWEYAITIGVCVASITILIYSITKLKKREKTMSTLTLWKGGGWFRRRRRIEKELEDIPYKEQYTRPQFKGELKTCPHCKKEFPKAREQCTHCHMSVPNPPEKKTKEEIEIIERLMARKKVCKWFFEGKCRITNLFICVDCKEFKPQYMYQNCPDCHTELVKKPYNSCSFCGWKGTKTQERSRTIPKAVQREVWRRDMGRCVECGSNERLEYDHVIPFSKGGSNTIRNIQLLCEKCNRSKYNNI